MPKQKDQGGDEPKVCSRCKTILTEADRRRGRKRLICIRCLNADAREQYNRRKPILKALLDGKLATCKKCGLEKPTHQFCKNWNMENGYISTCLACERIQKKAYADRWRAAGLCINCGGQKNDPSKSSCHKCRKRSTEHKAFMARVNKKKAIEYKGGCCQRCGYTSDFLSVFDFHHSDPSVKEVGIGVLVQKYRKFDDLKPELDKCELVCANCHRIIHETEFDRYGREITREV